MTEPVSAALAGATLVKKGKDPGLLKRVLGPPADELGTALARWVAFRMRNVGIVLDSAERKLGDRINEPGQVPTRVAAKILEEGSYCEEHIVAEYLGGVLASSRTTISRDDRGARWIALITALSAYEIRAHYVLYAALRLAYVRNTLQINWGQQNDLAAHDFILGVSDLAEAMDFSDSEPAIDILSEALFALNREGLLTSFQTDPPESFESKTQRRCQDVAGALTFTGSPVGVQLFMWAQGQGELWRTFGDPSLSFPDIDIAIPKAQLLKELDLLTPSPDQPAS